MSSKQDDDEYENKLKEQQLKEWYYAAQKGLSGFHPSGPITYPPGPPLPILRAIAGGITDDSTLSTGTFTGNAYRAGASSGGAVTDCKYFVMYFDSSIGGYKGTWWDTEEEAAEDVRKIQANNGSTHVVILTKDQEWLRTWERR